MTFTDDDLKRLKEYVEKLSGMKISTMATVDTPKLVALLARLEAAENVIREADILEAEHCCEDCPCGYIRMRLEAWLKAAGK